MVALTRPVWIHGAHAFRMRALLMRGAMLEVLNDRLEGHRLQAERGEKQERQGPSPFWGKWESSRAHDDPQSENFPTMTFWVWLHR